MHSFLTVPVVLFEDMGSDIRLDGQDGKWNKMEHSERSFRVFLFVGTKSKVFEADLYHPHEMPHGQSLIELRHGSTWRDHLVTAAIKSDLLLSCRSLCRVSSLSAPVMAEIRGTTGMMSQAEEGLKLFEAQAGHLQNLEDDGILMDIGYL